MGTKPNNIGSGFAAADEADRWSAINFHVFKQMKSPAPTGLFNFAPGLNYLSIQLSSEPHDAER